MADWSSFSSSLAALYEGLLPHGTEMDAVPRKNKGKVDLFLLSAISRAISWKKASVFTTLAQMRFFVSPKAVSVSLSAGGAGGYSPFA